jgi:hypothetical protein
VKEGEEMKKREGKNVKQTVDIKNYPLLTTYYPLKVVKM